MNAGATADRVYEALREKILAHGFRPGERIDPAQMAEELVASVTPVRDALHRLVGEDLVETRQGAGFFLPALDEPALQDLYVWSGQLAQLTLRSWPHSSSLTEIDAPPEPTDPADCTAMIFAAIGRRSSNAEHLRALQRVSARLHAVRVIEPRVIADVGQELQELQTDVIAGDQRRVAQALRSYHRRRLRSAAEMVRAVYRID